MNEFPSVPGYRLISILGEGGMGRVYLAEDALLGRRTAIKFVSERMSADPEARARFLREARTMAAVEHAHVVRVYAFGENSGGAYLVMEYVAGESLAERLRRTRQLEVTEAIRITRQVAEALDAAWEHHLVHRDIKPSNILIDARGQVRVADFGLAKPLGAAATDESLTQAGAVVGWSAETPSRPSRRTSARHVPDRAADLVPGDVGGSNGAPPGWGSRAQPFMAGACARVRRLDRRGWHRGSNLGEILPGAG